MMARGNEKIENKMSLMYERTYFQSLSLKMCDTKILYICKLLKLYLPRLPNYSKMPALRYLKALDGVRLFRLQRSSITPFRRATIV